MNTSEKYHTIKQQEDIERMKSFKQFIRLLILMKTKDIKKCSAGAYYKQV